MSRLEKLDLSQYVRGGFRASWQGAENLWSWVATAPDEDICQFFTAYKDLNFPHIAMHEAAHAIAAGFLADQVEFVTIVPNPCDYCGGRVRSCFTVNDGQAKYINWGYIVMTLAGPVASTHLDGIVSDGNKKDLSTVINYLSTGFTIEDQIFYIKTGLAGAAHIVQDPVLWGAVEKLAERLLIEGTVSGSDVQDLLNKYVRNNPRKPEFVKRVERMGKALRATSHYNEQRGKPPSANRAYQLEIKTANLCFYKEMKKLLENSSPINGL